ncbi:glutamate 5-kinase [Bacillus solimangrovi]|uniref:Glutamate 5-kinase n=1 Tax=Bacillus solimangrovi TaxID=1305675 RepID=A0A1E5LJE1_9BACI|nr:glutamate 5-kinase [Bacillus solimangrovi]OEH94200.1 glutamate 5-kinase [Bacillus solimangrovi]
MTKKRIVVKIGSSSLTNEKGGLAEQKLSEHVDALVRLKERGHEVVLISSGAVAAGFTDLGYPTRPITIVGKQAAAAVGQGLLMQGYTEKFKTHQIVTAQMLLTRQNFHQKEQYCNAYNALNELLKRGVLPIINENDSVAVEELTFGDNDMLSALVAGMIHADMLIILTDVNGLYDKNPKVYSDAKKYAFLPYIEEQLFQEASEESSSGLGTGGMRSKIEAAQTSLSLGISAFIGMGEGTDKLVDILQGKGNGTYIGNPVRAHVNNTKQWVGLHSEVKGTIVVDEGAKLALTQRQKSLLPAGVVDVTGDFSAGDVVEVIDQKGKVLGKGQVNYESEELQTIKGLPSDEAIEKTNRKSKVVIHRNQWVENGKESVIK